MYKPTLLLLCFFMALLMGCQASYSPPPQTVIPPPSTAIRPPPPASVKVEDSKFENAVTFIGIEGRHVGNQYNRYFLRSFMNKKSGQVAHQLYVSDHYDGYWEIWSRANSEDAQPLEFVSISRDVVYCGSGYAGCSLSEVFGAFIPDTDLRTHQDGYSVKFYAKSGKQMVIRLSSEQIRKQLKAIDDFQITKKD